MTRFNDLDDIWVSATSQEEIPQAIQQITSLLRERHRISRGRTRRFQNPRPDGNFTDAGLDAKNNDTPADLRGVNIADSRRCRYYEHNAGFGNGANEGNWCADGDRRTGQRYPAPVPDRSGDSLSSRRRGGHTAWPGRINRGYDISEMEDNVIGAGDSGRISLSPPA